MSVNMTLNVRTCELCPRRISNGNLTGRCLFHRGLAGMMCRRCGVNPGESRRHRLCVLCDSARIARRCRRCLGDCSKDSGSGLCLGCVNEARARRCQHCGGRIRTRSRVLCEECRDNPEVLAIFPAVEKFGRGCRPWGLGHDGDDDPPRRPEPTTAVPGSDEKIAVLAARVEARQGLWHPDDARFVHNSLGSAVLVKGGSNADDDTDEES